MSDVQAHLTDIIANIPDLTSHRFIGPDEDCISVAVHGPGEVAERVAAVLLAEFDVLPKGELTEETRTFWNGKGDRQDNRDPWSRLVSEWKRAET